LLPHEQAERLDEMENEAKAAAGSMILTKLLMPAVAKVARATQRHQASVQNLGVWWRRRHRRANGKWPEKVSPVPVYLPEVPLDPFDGKRSACAAPPRA
jgi:hypothetical protein